MFRENNVKKHQEYLYFLVQKGRAQQDRLERFEERYNLEPITISAKEVLRQNQIPVFKRQNTIADFKGQWIGFYNGNKLDSFVFIEFSGDGHGELQKHTLGINGTYSKQNFRVTTEDLKDGYLNVEIPQNNGVISIKVFVEGIFLKGLIHHRLNDDLSFSFGELNLIRSSMFGRCRDEQCD